MQPGLELVVDEPTDPIRPVAGSLREFLHQLSRCPY